MPVEIFGHVKQMQQEKVIRMVMKLMVLPENRTQRTPKRMWSDCVAYTIQTVGDAGKDVNDRGSWRKMVLAIVTHMKVGTVSRSCCNGWAVQPT